METMIADSSQPPARHRRHGDSPDAPPAGGAPAERRFSAGALFGSSREVIIELAGVDYRLRITSNGKLVLNK
jgi:hemin uptake protein HemP